MPEVLGSVRVYSGPTEPPASEQLVIWFKTPNEVLVRQGGDWVEWQKGQSIKDALNKE